MRPGPGVRPPSPAKVMEVALYVVGVKDLYFVGSKLRAPAVPVNT